MSDSRPPPPSSSLGERSQGGPKSFEEELALRLECPICLSYLEKPMSLDCSHVFCKVCINEWIRSNSISTGGNGSCPECRTLITRVTPTNEGKILSKLARNNKPKKEKKKKKKKKKKPDYERKSKVSEALSLISAGMLLRTCSHRPHPGTRRCFAREYTSRRLWRYRYYHDNNNYYCHHRYWDLWK